MCGNGGVSKPRRLAVRLLQTMAWAIAQGQEWHGQAEGVHLASSAGFLSQDG